MKVTITMKDPDGVYDGITEAAQRSVAGMKLSDDEREELEESRREKIKGQLDKWFEYNEYVDIEIDLDAGTATVRERR